MIQLGLIGQSIAASRSPALHVMLGELVHNAVSYRLHEPIDASAPAFVAQLQQLRAAGYRGVNVTYPYKQVAVHEADVVNEAVRKTGASNTLLLVEGKVSAFNTDYTGFIRGYRGRVGDLPAGRVLMIGAGGVGRAIAFALFELGATELLVNDLNMAGAESLVESIKAAGYSAHVVASEDLALAAQSAHGLVNCTPVGHYKTPGRPLDPVLIGGQTWAFDAVYTPMDTEFLVEAHKKGLKIVSGFDLFFYQGIDAFEIFTGATLGDVQPVIEAFRRKFEVTSALI